MFAPVVIGLLLQRRTVETTPWDRLYLRFCERLARMGVVRAPGEAPVDFARRATRQLPRLSDEIEEVTRLYTDLAYAVDGDPDQLQRMQQAIRSIA